MQKASDARWTLSSLGSFAELGVIAAILCTLGLVAHVHLEAAQAATRYSDTLMDLRLQMRAVEAYASDTGHYPRMSFGALNVPGMTFNDQYQGRPVYGTLTPLMTTPVAFLPALMEDPVLSASTGQPELYSYHSHWTHEFISYMGVSSVPPTPVFVYRPTTTVKRARIERYFGHYVLWGSGPQGAPGVNAATYFLQYDPTNGATSSGNIFIAPYMPSPAYVDPTLL